MPPEISHVGSASPKESTALNPRRYQRELLERATRENVIAVLGTGKGKTLIAVLLLRHVLNEERARGGLRKVAFLVNQVHLVIQQAKVIRDNVPVRVLEFYGEMDVDRWDLQKWRSVLDEADVVVLTSQILLDVFSHDYAKLEEVPSLFGFIMLDNMTCIVLFVDF